MGNRMQIRGSPGDSEKGGNAAVVVLPGGSFVLDGADVFGGDDSVEKPASSPFLLPSATTAGEGIRAEHAEVTLNSGTAAGGNARAMSGDAFGGDGISLLGSILRIRGGRVRAGEDASPKDFSVSPGWGVLARSSAVEMTGGIVKDTLNLQSSSTLDMTGGELPDDLAVGSASVATIRGGVVGRVLAASFEPVRACVEISGGHVQGPILVGQADLFILGTEFNLPFGEVSAQGPVGIIGRLADGQELGVIVRRFFSGSRIFLVERDSVPTGPDHCPAMMQ